MSIRNSNFFSPPSLNFNQNHLTEEELLGQLSEDDRAKALAQSIMDDQEIYFPKQFDAANKPTIPYTIDLMEKVINFLKTKGFEIEQKPAHNPDQGVWLRIRSHSPTQHSTSLKNESF